VVSVGKNRDRLTIFAAILEIASPVQTKPESCLGQIPFQASGKISRYCCERWFYSVDNSVYLMTEAGRHFLRQDVDFH